MMMAGMRNREGRGKRKGERGKRNDREKDGREEGQ